MSGTYQSTGFQMIRNIEIRNFRCYRHLELAVPARLNVIVGDNGSGKTSLLEAVFLALCSTSQIALRYRQERGMEGAFNGTSRRVEEAIFGDLFTGRDTRAPISIRLDGDGEDNRSVTVSRGPSTSVLPFGDSPPSNAVSTLPISFTWTASGGHEYTVQPTISANTLTFPDTGEDLADFFFVPTHGMVGSVELANRFSDLSAIGRREEFVRFISREYPWILDLRVEAIAGAPSIFAEVKGVGMMPLPSVSSGINRAVGYLLCMAARPQSVVLIDEIEVGTHYSHHKAIWSGIMSFMRQYDSQLFITTHSKECLEALASAAHNDSHDIALWRVEATKRGDPYIRQFSGEDLIAGVEYGQEVR